MNTPENTSERDATIHALGILSEGSESYITGMEAAGQRQLVASETLPTDTSGTDEAFLALGFTFGDPDPRDPMFRPATLPEGWRKERSDHSMWSYVVDHLDRQRVAVFYKAAFYDRSAFMRLESVYGYVSKLEYTNAQPIFDDEWCTHEAFAEGAAALRKRRVERVEFWQDHSTEQSAKYVREAADDLAKYDRWAAQVERPVTE